MRRCRRAFEGDRRCVAGGAGACRRRSRALAEQGIHQGGLYDVRDGRRWRRGDLVVRVFLLVVGREGREHELDQLADAVAVRRRDQADRRGRARKSASDHRAVDAFGIVDDHQVVARRGAGARRCSRRGGVPPARPSTRNSSTSASAMACSAWRAISCMMPSLATGREAGGPRPDNRGRRRDRCRSGGRGEARLVGDQARRGARQAVEQGRLCPHWADRPERWWVSLASRTSA